MAEKAERLMFMYNNKVKSIIASTVSAAICISMTSVLSGCGQKEVTVYKSFHASGECTISSIKDLLFVRGTSPEEIAKTIPDLCLYEGYKDIDYDEGEEIEEDYSAKVRLNIEGNENIFDICLHFNADKEFIGWADYEERVFGQEAIDERYQKWYQLFYNSFGTPNTTDYYAEWGFYDEEDYKYIELKVEINDSLFPLHASVEYTPGY